MTWGCGIKSIIPKIRLAHLGSSLNFGLFELRAKKIPSSYHALSGAYRIDEHNTNLTRPKNGGITTRYYNLIRRNAKLDNSTQIKLTHLGSSIKFCLFELAPRKIL